MKQYLLSVYHHEGEPERSAEQMQASYDEVGKVNEELQAAGVWVFAGGLMPPTSATVVRMDKGGAVLTDGPFAETKEQVGGFWIIQAEDLDAALAWTAKCAEACGAPVEVRPFHDEP